MGSSSTKGGDEPTIVKTAISQANHGEISFPTRVQSDHVFQQGISVPMPVLFRWEADYNEKAIAPAKRRCGVWRYDDSSESEATSGANSRYLGSIKTN